MAGIAGVPVVFGGPGAEAQADGLTLPILQEDVAKRLKRAGVPTGDSGEPFLYIMIDARLVNGSSQYAYTVVVELRQRVSVPRSRGVKALAATWSKSTTGVLPRQSIKNVRAAVADLVDEFAAAYKSAN